jgi:hypothetical protein
MDQPKAGKTYLQIKKADCNISIRKKAGHQLTMGRGGGNRLRTRVCYRRRQKVESSMKQTA